MGDRQRCAGRVRAQREDVTVHPQGIGPFRDVPDDPLDSSETLGEVSLEEVEYFQEITALSNRSLPIQRCYERTAPTLANTDAIGPLPAAETRSHIASIEAISSALC